MSTMSSWGQQGGAVVSTDASQCDGFRFNPCIGPGCTFHALPM